jgi:hypothetical protein
MSNSKLVLALALTLLMLSGAGRSDQIGTSAISLESDGSSRIENDGASTLVAPRVTVLFSARNPGMSISKAMWDLSNKGEEAAPEGWRLLRWSDPNGKRTDNMYEVGEVYELKGIATRQADGSIKWVFPDNPNFKVWGTVQLARQGEPPVVALQLKALRPGWFSLGYSGMESISPDNAEALYQPRIWQERRVPRAPLLTAESMASLPMTIVQQKERTIGLVVDPTESPFRMPTLGNARFGVVLRSRDGNLQPAAYAPILGGSGSRLGVGDTASIRLRPLVMRGSWYDMFRTTATNMFGFNDRRENTGVSLNQTIDNMTEYALDDRYSGWNADLKGFDYRTDVPNTVKVVSALHPLSVALIQDDRKIYDARALPLIEYLLSREKFLFTADPAQKGQSASSRMAGPAAEMPEFAALHTMARGRTPIYAELAQTLVDRRRVLNGDLVSDGNSFPNLLALYRLDRNPMTLARAKRAADAYLAKRLDTPQTDFSDMQIPASVFWSDFAPRWIDLFELYEETGERRYLDAAHRGAALYASFAWFYPVVPNGDVTVDPGGRAIAGWTDGPKKDGMRSPERRLPAWVVSQVGLMPEAGDTHDVNPAVLLAPHASYFLRIAEKTGDTFLHQIARSSVVGRYASYPGYDINYAFSNVYARADYPMRKYEKFSYNQIYYNHVWPQIAFLHDYLISDTEVRSRGQIAFPSRYAIGYAYLKTKVYGDRPGRFLTDENVNLWMPRGLIRSNNPQINYLVGEGNGKIYIALNNESKREVDAQLLLDRRRVMWQRGKAHKATVFVDGRKTADTFLVNGRIRARVGSQGQTAIIIEGVPIVRTLRTDYEAPAEALPQDSHVRWQSDAGTIDAGLLRFDTKHTSLYIWCGGSNDDIRRAKLSIDVDGTHQTVIDDKYPFEFSLPTGLSRSGKIAIRVTIYRNGDRQPISFSSVLSDSIRGS